MKIYDGRACLLGEGPLWHPEREQLFWFDIINRKLLTREGGREDAWTFNEMVSAAGWVDKDTLVVAGETKLVKFTIATGRSETIAALKLGEGRRSNDGRADPWGGFWISAMGKQAEKDAGAIYRFYKGETAQLFNDITIPNAICFAPDRSVAYFSDTDRSVVKKVALDQENGRPVGEPELFIDFGDEGLNPDGAVVDAEGNFWCAQWGAGRVAAYRPDGQFLRSVAVGAPQSSCPAFGGPDFSTLFCTTAREGMDEAALAEQPDSGKVFMAENIGRGLAEPRVLL